MLICGLLPRVISRSVDISPLPEDDMRRYFKKKELHALHFVSAPDTELNAALITWTTIPLDHVCLQVQHKDVHQHILFDLADDDRNPFKQAHRQ